MQYSNIRLSGLAVACTALPLLLAFGVSGHHGIASRHVSGISQPIEDEEIPNEIAALMRHAGELMSRHDAEQFATISTAASHLTRSWIISDNLKWSVDAIAVPHAPAEDPIFLAVFHCWHTCESNGDHVYRIVSTDAGWKIGEEIPEYEPGGFRIRDHDLSVTTDISHKTVDITDRVKFERLRQSDAGFALMRLSEDYRVDKMTAIDERGGSPVAYRQAGGVVAFTPPGGETFSLNLHYTGTVDHADGDFLHNDEVTLSSYWYPVIARLPATATVTTTAKPGFTALAQGELIKSQTVAAGTKVTYRNDVPVSYFSLDIGRYSVTTRKAAGHTLSVYLLDPSASLAKQCLDTTERALAYYETHFGSFPYTRYGIVQTHGVSEMALEAYSFATFGPHTLPDLIPHELSHTWWGGRIPCTYLHSMWNEAFADYSDDLFQRSLGRRSHLPTAAEVAAERRKISHAYDAMPLGQACDTNNGTQSTIGYDKGSKVLRVLEDELGQEMMLKCMAAFLKDHQLGEAAEWSDFEVEVKKMAKAEYGWFFRQWLDLPGLPNVRFENVVVHSTARGKLVSADIVQSGEPYRLDLDCRISTLSGKASVTRQQIAGARTHLEISLDTAPEVITLDPNAIVPLAPPPGGDQDSDYTVYRFTQ